MMASTLIGELPDLWKETYDLVSQVPEGKVTTYGAVARALGDVVASRFVGLAMSRNEDIVRVPCRRVVQSDGSLGGYTGGGPSKKAALLRKEGISVSRGRIQDMDRVFFDDFRTRFPLRSLRSRQLSLRKRLRLEDRVKNPDFVAGIDVAYSGDRAFAAMTVLDNRKGELLHSAVRQDSAFFPYVPTYLAFREIPVVLPLLDDLSDQLLVLYDGNGILHPERFGIASQFGVMGDIPTVGVAKKLLCGTVRGAPGQMVRAVVGRKGLLGHALCRRAGGSPVYVSAGHLTSPAGALRLAKRFLVHRVPEPTRLAHIEAEKTRRARNHK